jgi:hypothetical protein
VRRGNLLALLAAILVTAGCFASRYRTRPRVAVVGGDPIVQMSEPASFPSAFDPPMVPLERHSHPPRGRQHLIGLPDLSPPRAYPIGLLDRFEVVNDSAGGEPYVIARCALTHVVAAWSRRVERGVLTFENTAALWRDTAVMRDRETQTWWSVATGKALHGPLSDSALKPVPAVYATVEAWRRARPDSLWMDLRAPTSEPFLMRLYRAGTWQGVSGQKTSDRRHPPKREVLSVAAGVEALAFTSKEVRSAGSVNTTFAGEQIVLRWDRELEAVRARLHGGAEIAVVPMYWFALDRHFETVWTLEDGRTASRLSAGTK